MDDDARFQLAARSARRIVSQCRAHVDRTSDLLAREGDVPAAAGVSREYTAAQLGRHPAAFKRRLENVEVLTNALLSHLLGLEGLMKLDVFHGLPATLIVRGIAEVSAICVWMLRPDISDDARAARGYASVFRSVESSIAAVGPDDASGIAKAREALVADLEKSGVVIKRKVVHKKATDVVARVIVGEEHADTEIRLGPMVGENIPLIGAMYPSLSSIAHGEMIHAEGAWERPDLYARRIGFVTMRSVERWSEVMSRLNRWSQHSRSGVCCGTSIGLGDGGCQAGSDAVTGASRASPCEGA